MASRREGNRELGRPGLLEAPHAVFPELEIKAAPHMDTVNRLLEGIEPEQLEEALRERIRSLPRRHKSQGLLVRNRHVIAIDGTQKLSLDWCWAQEAQHWQLSRTAMNGRLWRWSASTTSAWPKSTSTMDPGLNSSGTNASRAHFPLSCATYRRTDVSATTALC